MTKYTGLSPVQRETLFYIVEFFKRNQTQPSYRELCEHFGVTKQAICDRLTGLNRKGYVEIVPLKARSTRITEKGFKAYVNGE